MHERAFVLMPLIELAAAIDIPGHGRADRFVDALSDQAVERLDP